MKANILAAFVCMGLGLGQTQTANREQPVERQLADRKNHILRTTEQTKIQVALLMDTSSSMDGLIEQAKSQLWQIVNELATARYSGVQPVLEIALYEYGNDGLDRNNGFIRQVLPFTTDLDKVSEELFKLRTNGGDEFCGYVIDKAVSQLEWTNSDKDLKLIYIAGNEPFNQGSTDYKTACKNAITHGIVVNTIFCGGINEGISGFWKNGAELADGKYMNIDQNQSTVYVQTPWDDELVKLNDELNNTYIAYGNEGEEYKENQVQQDKNASTFGSANTVARVNTKVSGVYNASAWDLVDAKKDGSLDIDKVKTEDLPQEMRTMNRDEKLRYIESKTKEREEIQKKIADINKKRNEYIAEKQKEDGEQNNLNKAMMESVKDLAAKKNYEFEK